MNIDKVFIDTAIKIDYEISYLLEKIKRPPEKVLNAKTVYDYINAGADPIARAKKTLYITRNKGAIIKKCPGTFLYRCCDYTILHSGAFCSMDCSYCILQAYFHPPVLRYFAGFDQLQKCLSRQFAKDKIFRIGTGEYTDSLIWEPVSLLPEFLIKHFAGQHNSALELKTKTANIHSLLDIDHNQKTILSWSVNTHRIIQSEEKGTAALKRRLQAAKNARKKGYRLAFHFDPIVIYPGCETEYEALIDQIFSHIPPQDIVWISLGTFRFMPKLKQVIEKRFPASVICYGEFIQGLDNKMRYFKPVRIRIYKRIISAIQKFAPHLFLYFCMEDEEVWQKCLGYFPEKEGELGYLLDKRAVNHCMLKKDLL